jgi:flagellin-specific chaperone FliS
MSLSSEEKSLIAEHVSTFAMKMILSVGSSEEDIHENLDDFYEFFCNALSAAKRDARREALTTTTN